MLIKFYKLTLIILFSLMLNSVFASDKVGLTKPIKKYIHTIAKKYKFNQSELLELFSQVRFNEELMHRLKHPAEKMPWSTYRNIFITPEKIEEGVAFWEKHKKVLHQAEEKYGIPANVIVAIIGVETRYGKHTGIYPELDTLTTLAFYYKPRARFFRGELTEYLLLTREQKLPPLKLTGSYAGALGIPQFMPSAYRRYAISYDNKTANLINNPKDAIFSVANYLNEMGWRPHQPIAYSLNENKVITNKLISDSAIPHYSLTKLSKKGVKLPKDTNMQLKAAIINITENIPNAEYWLTFENFRTIMRYNPRIKYAMVVYQLSQALKKHRDTQQR